MKPIELNGSHLARNTLLNFIGQVVPLLVGIVTIPFIIRGLGTDRFGLLSLAWVVLGYFTIFDLGLGRATTKFVAEALGKGEEDKLPQLVWTAITTQALLGLVGALILMVITPLLVERILNIPPALIGEAKAVFYLLALSLPVVFLSSSFQGVLEAAQRFDLVNAVRIPSSISTNLLTLVGVLLGLHLPGIVALNLAIRFITLLVLVVLNLQLFTKLRGFSASFALFPHLFSFGGWVTVSSIVGPIFTYLERFLIASFLSIGALTFYAVPYEVIARVVIFPASIAITMFPAFSYYGVSNPTKIQDLFSRSFTFLLLVMVPIAIIFVALADEILKLWLGGEFAQKSTLVFQILTITFFIHAFAHIPFVAVQGLGRPDLKAKLDLISLPIFVALCWSFIPKLGIIGAALAKLFITLIDVSCLLWTAKGLARLSIKEMFGKKIGRATIIAALSALSVFSFGMVSKPLVANIGVLIIFISVFLILFVKIVMDDRDRVVLKNIPRYLLYGGAKE